MRSTTTDAETKAQRGCLTCSGHTALTGLLPTVGPSPFTSPNLLATIPQPSGVSSGLCSCLTSCHTKKRETLGRTLDLPERPDLFHDHSDPVLQMKKLRPREGKSLSTQAGTKVSLTPNQRVFGYHCPKGQVRTRRLFKLTGERVGNPAPALLPTRGGRSSNPRLMMTIAVGHHLWGASNLLSSCQAVARRTPLHSSTGLLSPVYR